MNIHAIQILEPTVGSVPAALNTDAVAARDFYQGRLAHAAGLKRDLRAHEDKRPGLLAAGALDSALDEHEAESATRKLALERAEARDVPNALAGVHDAIARVRAAEVAIVQAHGEQFNASRASTEKARDLIATVEASACQMFAGFRDGRLEREWGIPPKK